MLQKDPRLGALKDKFKEKDWSFALDKPLAVRDLLNLAPYLPRRVDQGYIGSCTGASLEQYFAGFATLYKVVAKVGTQNRFSIWWIYNWARFIEGTLGEDAGAYLRDCLDAVRKYGVLIDDLWKYPDGCTKLDKTAPSSRLYPEAAKWPVSAFSPVPQLRLKGFYRVTGGAEGIFQALEAAQQAIDAGKPEHLFVYMGSPWWWEDTDKNGYLKIPTAYMPVLGGHAYLAYGGEQKRGLLHIVNTWGPGWGTYPLGQKSGEKGCAIMPAECIDKMKSEGGYDAYVISVEGGNWGTQPAPTPVPVSNLYNAVFKGQVELVPVGV